MMRRKKIDYSLVIALTCFVMLFFGAGLANSPASLYLVPVTEHYGFSRGDFSIVYSIVSIGMLISQLLFGALEKRVGVRVVVSIGVLAMPLGYFIYSQANTLPIFYLGAAFVGMGMAFASSMSASILIYNWFKDNQGLIFGAISAGTGFGGSFFIILIGNIIASRGFKSAFLFTTLVQLAAALFVIAFIRSKPKQAQTEADPSSQHLVQLQQTASSKEIFKQPENLLGILSILLIGLTLHPVYLIVPAYLIEKGFDPLFSANIASAIFFVLAFAKIIIGFLNDKLGIRFSLNVGVGAFAIAALILATLTQTWLVWVFVLFFGLSLSTLAVLIPLFARALLGSENFSRYLGLFVAAMSAGFTIGSPISNYIFDATGTYKVIIIIYAALSLLGLFLANLSLNKKARASSALAD